MIEAPASHEARIPNRGARGWWFEAAPARQCSTRSDQEKENDGPQDAVRQGMVRAKHDGETLRVHQCEWAGALREPYAVYGGLTIAAGQLYVTGASHCDITPYHGIN
jgi:hypothetical protein